jgi:tRNA A-37 threonylcarbamoyl transferase component Bud32
MGHIGENHTHSPLGLPEDPTIDATSRLTSALSDRYGVQRELGQGGMATVYLAEDLKHGRRVAIKLLHPELSAILGGDRFLAEIKVTANLQHPHILGLIDSGEADGLLYYVMPYVAGESLRARLARERQLPVEDAIRLAREVAAALDYAHRQGVVHRDIKPENILLQDGAALVADFGIALAVEQAGGHRMTQTGMSLGTPAYMSPEQAMGERDIGPRSDVYALGAMTYEMLAGEPPFTGPSSQAIVAKVLTEHPPPLRPKRPMVPPAAEAAILRALQKLPADRWGSAREFAEALAGTAQQPVVPADTVPIAAARIGTDAGSRRTVLWLGWIVAALATGVAAWAVARPVPELPPSRLAIMAPGLGGSGASSSRRHVTFLPDGEGVVYAVVGTDGQLRLVRQALDADRPAMIPGAVGLGSPLVSPNGRWLVGTASVNTQVLRLPLEGGTAELVARGMLSSDDASWAPDNSLWTSTDEGSLAEVVRDSLVRRVGRDQHRLQQMLPDGRTALVVRNLLGNSTGPVRLVDLRTGEASELLTTPVVEARITRGFLVFVTGNGNLQAAPLDRTGRRLAGEPVIVATGVAITGTAVGQFTVAANGNVAYIPEEPSSLVFVDRAGGSRLVTAERRNFHHPMFSPDGHRLSTDFNSVEGRNVWVLALVEGTLTRATFDREGHDATWTPDGRFLTYIAPLSQSGATTLVLLRKRPGSAEPAETLLVSPLLSYTGVWLRDGSGLVTTATGLRRSGRADTAVADSRADAALIGGAGKGPLTPLVASPFAEQYVGVSPDGRWISFVSDQSGRDEVYVRDLAGEQDQVLVSLEGGSEPVWGHDGKELFYRETAQDNPYLVAARIETGPTIRVASRSRLFPIADIVGTGPHANYDISPDGKTFVMVRRSPAARIVVIQNLPALVRRLRGERPPT